MSSSGSAGASDAPPFVLATRLFVHYKFKTRRSFDPARVLRDDAYAREVLEHARSTGDRALREMADRFEAVRFPLQRAASGEGAVAAARQRPFDLLLLGEP